MESDTLILVDVWREACRNIEIGLSTSMIASRLAKRMPLAGLVVRRLDLMRRSIDTVAVGDATGHGGLSVPGHTACSPDQIKILKSWESQGEIIQGNPISWRDVRCLLLPGTIRNDCLMGPIAAAEGHGGGALVALARSHSHFGPQDVAFFKSLLEPFSAALENDRRIHELAALREAAEAERSALLMKLGRKQIQNVIIGAEAGLSQVLERVAVVCSSDVPVLLLGETGTGKEVIARSIHSQSPRSERPFIRVNCGAIPPELIDSQLFGHERGSFTGALDTHKGWFERADTGTLFLDEIGELPAAAQVRLIRVLQDGYVERVGGKQTFHVDVRIVAATHRDLASMVRQKTFREDLWYRLAVFPIPIPPLRERPEDIPLLACHFAEKAAIRFGLPLAMPTPEDLGLLRQYSWPGNVRELGTVIDRAALLGNGVRLEVAKALGAVPSTQGSGDAVTVDRTTSQVSISAASESLPVSRVSGREQGPATASLDEVARQHIEEVLRSTYGRIEGPHGAARRLKVNPHTLRYRMRKLGIDWRKYRSLGLADS